jgi:hypothetical protein
LGLGAAKPTFLGGKLAGIFCNISNIYSMLIIVSYLKMLMKRIGLALHTKTEGVD